MNITLSSQFNYQPKQLSGNNSRPKGAQTQIQTKKNNASMIGKSFLSLMVAGGVRSFIHKIGLIPFSKVMKNPDLNLLNESIAVFDNVLPKTGLENKGVKVISAKNHNQILDLFEPNYSRLYKFFARKNPEIAQYLRIHHLPRANSIMNGKNASFLVRTKDVILNKEKGAPSLLHELGHALNSNKKGIGNVLHTLRRPVALLYPLILWAALLKPKKQDGEKPQGFFDKATTFIKNHCGKLAFAVHIPLLLEEGLASIKGAKLAKEFLSTKSLKSLNKLNFVAWLTYLGSVTAMTLQTVTVSKLQDKFREPKKTA
jgi:hypothetical protein